MGAIQQLLSQQSGGKGGDSNPGQLSSSASNSHFMYPSSAVSLALSIESPFSGNFYSFILLHFFLNPFIVKYNRNLI